MSPEHYWFNKMANRKAGLSVKSRQASAKPAVMYRRPKFLEVLHAIREEMSREADYDVDLFTEFVRSGVRPAHGPERSIRGFKSRAPRAEDTSGATRKTKQTKRQSK